MKAVIFAGGYGTRISEETASKPKPMVPIGQKPILWHIMKLYSHHGINDFIICLGYMSDAVKDYFSNYYRYMSDLTFDLRDNSVTVHHNVAEPWRVTLVDTGLDSKTGLRLAKVRKYLEGEEAFCLTYGDGVSDVNIADTIAFHKKHGRLATLTATRPSGRFGALQIDDSNRISSFVEKPKDGGDHINGGFFVLSPKVIDYIDGDQMFEQEPMQKLTDAGQLMAYRYDGFWHAMDTLRDRNHLEQLWRDGQAPWKVWHD